jgi:hypothetical protein
MICCFSLDLNDIKGGEAMGFYVQALTEPDKVVGQKCIVKVYEVDTLVGKRKETTPDDLLAEFETIIEKGSREQDFYFNLDATKRIDSFPMELPEPEIRNDPKGNPLPVPLKYTPPYFKVFFDSGAPRPAESDMYTILIRSDENEIEMYNYEIGFTIELDGQMIFDARKMVAYVDCTDFLVENCRNAADFIVENHNNNLISKRRCGTHYGNMYPYSFKNETEYLGTIRRINPTAADEYSGKWNNDQKIIFDANNREYGIKMTSCIDFVIDTLETGFQKTTMRHEWEICKKYITSKRSGQELAKGLTEIGWVALYYSPDTVNFYDYDLENIHRSSFEHAKQTKKYGNDGIKPIIPVFDFVINYSPTIYYDDGAIVKKPIKPEKDQFLKVNNLPFAFLLAKYGYHTAILINGKVSEVHWAEGPYVKHLFETEKEFYFRPSRPDNYRIYNSWEWLSGLIVVPRNYWRKATYEF